MKAIILLLLVLCTGVVSNSRQESVKFLSISTQNLGDSSFRVQFQVTESVNTHHYDVQVYSPISNDWETVSVVLADSLQPGKIYTANVKLKP